MRQTRQLLSLLAVLPFIALNGCGSSSATPTAGDDKQVPNAAAAFNLPPSVPKEKWYALYMDKGTKSKYRLKFTDAGATSQYQPSEAEFILLKKNGKLGVYVLADEFVRKHEIPANHPTLTSDYGIDSWEQLQSKKLGGAGEPFTFAENLPVEATANTITIDWGKLPEKSEIFSISNSNLPHGGTASHYRIEDDGLRLSNIANFQYATEEWVRE